MFKLNLVILLTSFFIGTSATVAEGAPLPVKVGGYAFEPFVEGNIGVTPGFVALLNSNQQQHRFEFVPIPAQRRYQLLQEGKIDAIFFEMLQWGWERRALSVDVTRPIIAGREVFVVSRDHVGAISKLENPTKHSMALTLGYHYAFAGFNANQDYLKKHFNVQFAPKQRTALKYLLKGSADVALASEIFLHAEYLRDSELEQQLLISERADQFYELPLLMRKDGPINAETFNQLLDGLVECDCLAPFFASYGLEKLLTYKTE